MKGIRKFWLRFWVVFLIQTIIKSFDHSFPRGPFELNFRSFVFTFFFIIYGLFIWLIADFFNGYFENLTRNIKKELNRIVILTSLHAILGFILSVSLNHLYRAGDIYLFGNAENWDEIIFLNPELTVALTCLYLLILGFDGYFETQKNLQSEILKAQELEKENLLAQYMALKAQIEPHFLFNSLSVLSSLVYEDADLSADFIVKLSKTLRYVIEKNEFHLVKLSEELEFLNAYFFLIKTRLNDGVFLETRLEKLFVENTYIPPVTLQLLVENAVAHNKYNPEDPLIIVIETEDDFMVVRNNLNLRQRSEPSTKTGLKNLKKRYELISKKQILVNAENGEFTVKIPSLKQADYERFIV
jgi:sensor histidine kinase YesM